MPFDLTNMLSWWQWAALAAVPPAIIALYFLKLKRSPLEVPSTYLWRKSIEDLHVNSLWQKLRQSLLLFLQLLLLLLLILALLGPSWQSSALSGGRYIFLVDNSASMGATDVPPTRLEEAKRRTLALIDQMKSGDEAMIVSFSDGARVEQVYTDNRQELRRRLAEIKQTQKTTSLDEALRVVSGLANPGRRSSDNRDVQVAEAMPADLYIFSDGKFKDVSNFSVGNLRPIFVPLGKPDAANVAIVAFDTSRNDEKPDQLQAFARVENFGLQEASVLAELHLNGALVDADQVTVPAGGSTGVAFDLSEPPNGVLELRLNVQDVLEVDNRAWATVNAPRRAKVLCITPGDEPLELALTTNRSRALADVTRQAPDYLETPAYAQAAAAGVYDLIIYDRCRPKEMPQANTLFIGQIPPGDAWSRAAAVSVPQVIDIERAHPMMQLVELGDVLFAEGTPLTPPPASAVLIDTTAGPLAAVGPREGFEDAVLGFEIVSRDGIGTNWPMRLSFPVFWLNVLEYLGGSKDQLAAGSVQPGRPIAVRLDTQANLVGITTPSQGTIKVDRGRLNTFNFTGTDQVGVYEVRDGRPEVAARFTVNLFDPAESDVKPRAEKTIKIGHVEVAASEGWEAARRDAWKLLLLLALAVLLFEWYIYNRRVYL